MIHICSYKYSRAKDNTGITAAEMKSIITRRGKCTWMDYKRKEGIKGIEKKQNPYCIKLLNIKSDRLNMSIELLKATYRVDQATEEDIRRDNWTD
jgi:hypothetical protein